MDEEVKWIVGGIAALTTFGGLYQSIRVSVLLRVEAQNEHKKIIRLLEEIIPVVRVLKDHQAHPESSGFGTNHISHIIKENDSKMDKLLAHHEIRHFTPNNGF